MGKFGPVYSPICQKRCFIPLSALANNVRMMQLMKSLDFRITNDPDDHSIKVVVAQLHASNP